MSSFGLQNWKYNIFPQKIQNRLSREFKKTKFPQISSNFSLFALFPQISSFFQLILLEKKNYTRDPARCVWVTPSLGHGKRWRILAKLANRILNWWFSSNTFRIFSGEGGGGSKSWISTKSPSPLCTRSTCNRGRITWRYSYLTLGTKLVLYVLGFPAV